MSDPAKYRSRDEVSKIRKESDPIDLLRGLLEDDGYADEATLKEMDRQVKMVVTEAAEFAQQSPEPDPAELWTEILIEAA